MQLGVSSFYSLNPPAPRKRVRRMHGEIMLWSPRDLSKLTWAKVKDRRGVKGPREGCEAVKPPQEV